MSLILLSTWSMIGRGNHSKTFSFYALCSQSTPSWLKVIGGVGWGGVGWGGVVGHVILVSPQSQLDFGFFTSLSLELGLGGQGLGLGFDNL